MSNQLLEVSNNITYGTLIWYQQYQYRRCALDQIDHKIQRLAGLAASLNQEDRQYAFQQVAFLSAPDLLAFAKEVSKLRGWGRGLQKAVSRWYARFTPEQLQALVKGSEIEHIWLWRRAHVVPKSTEHSELFGRVIEHMYDLALEEYIA